MGKSHVVCYMIAAALSKEHQFSPVLLTLRCNTDSTKKEHTNSLKNNFFDKEQKKRLSLSGARKMSRTFCHASSVRFLSSIVYNQYFN